jgi:hypothetical protein
MKILDPKTDEIIELDEKNLTQEQIDKYGLDTKKFKPAAKKTEAPAEKK